MLFFSEVVQFAYVQFFGISVICDTISEPFLHLKNKWSLNF